MSEGNSGAAAGSLRARYEAERDLADRLRAASAAERRAGLYGEVYEERSRIVGHPLVERAGDSAARHAAAAPQARLLRGLTDRDSFVCEIGAGDGAVSHMLAPHVRRCVALDVTDALALPDDPRRGYEFGTFDGFAIALSEPADLIYSNDVTEHLHPDDMREQARAIRDALRPGGEYVCVTPNRITGPHDVSAAFSDTATGFHLREYTATELRAELRAAGFRTCSFVVSVGGRRLTPRLPVWLLTPIEAVLSRLPRGWRRRLGRPLAAAKIIARR